MSQQVQGSSANQRVNESAQHANINRRVSAQTMSCRKLNLNGAGCVRSHKSVLAGPGRQSGTKAGCGGSAAARSASTASRRHRNSRLGAMPWRRATAETVVAALFASAKTACFCSRVHARRVPATTTCAGFDIGPDMLPIYAQTTSCISPRELLAQGALHRAVTVLALGPIQKT